MIVRIAIDIAMLIAVFTVPWWFTLPLLFVLSVYFRSYIEALVFGIMLDAVYGGGFFYTLFAVSFLIIGSFIRKQLRINHEAV